MNIAICIKHVPVSNDVSVDPVTHALIRENTEGMVNPADLNAIEEAVALKEKTGAKLVVFTMGPREAETSLRTAISMGCDEAVLVTDRSFAGADTIATSRVLACALQHYGGFDLILAGAQTSDGATGQVGPMIAAQLGIPHISDAQSVCLDENGGKAAAEKKYMGDMVRLSAVLPALVTMSFGCNTPRFPTLRARLAANKKEIASCGNAELGLPEASVGLAGSPTEVVASFQPERGKKAEMLSGSAREIAAKIISLIEKEKGNI